MKRLLFIFLTIFLCSCNKVEEQVCLQVYYVGNCGYCEQFKEEAEKYLHKRYQHLTIEYLDLDEKENLDRYDQVIDALDDFDQSEYRSTPAIVYEPYFMVVGYESGDEKILDQDIRHALKNETYEEAMQEYRWEFKQ